MKSTCQVISRPAMEVKPNQLIWHNSKSLGDCFVVTPALSNHYAVFVDFKVNHDTLPKSIRFRDYNEA